MGVTVNVIEDQEPVTINVDEQENIKVQVYTPVGEAPVDDKEYVRKNADWVENSGGGSGTDPNAIHINTAGEISGATAKITPVDADLVVIEDSATIPTAFGKKKLSWTNIKATLKAYFDTLYAYSGMNAAFQFGGQVSGGYSIESFSPTKTFYLNNGVAQEMVITGNITSLTLSDKVNGGSYLIYLVENGTGGYTIPTPDSTFGNKTDNSADFVTTANAVNLININVRPNGMTYYTIETYTP